MAGRHRVVCLCLLVAMALAANSQAGNEDKASKYEKYYNQYKLMTSSKKMPGVAPISARLYRPHLYHYKRHFPNSRRSSNYRPASSYRTQYRSASPAKSNRGEVAAGKKYIIEDKPMNPPKVFSRNHGTTYSRASLTKSPVRSKKEFERDQTKIMRSVKPVSRKVIKAEETASHAGRNYLKNLLTKYELPERDNATFAPTFIYVCPPEFLRLGNGCYYVSKALGSWQWAHFECRARKSQLAVLGGAWEDGVLRGYLNRGGIAPLNRWIGGIHDWQRGRWQWGSSGAPMKYQGFLSVATDTVTSPRWSCAYMDPEMYYRWSYAKCTERMHFICEAPFTKVKKQ